MQRRWLVPFLLGCTSSSSPSESNAVDAATDTNIASEDTGGGFDASGCTGEELTCNGTIAHPCNQPKEMGTDCATTGKICFPKLGCVTCAPGSGTCSEAAATVCRSDGSGLIEFACDSALGLKCEGTRCVGPCSPAVIEDSYIGCEYFPTTVLNNVNNSYDFEIAVANASLTEVANITITGGALTAAQKVTVAAGKVERVKLPWQEQVKVCNEKTAGGSFDLVNACSDAHAPDYSSRVVTKGAYRVASDRPVAVWQYAPIQGAKGGFQAGTTEASLLIPQTALGNSYHVATYGQGFARGAIAIVATVDGTKVTVMPTSDLTAGAGSVAVTAGATASYSANRGDVIELISAKNHGTMNVGDLTGSSIVANHPVQVFGVHGCAWVIDTRSCDHLEDVMLPDRTLGTDYLVKASTYPGSAAYLVRVIATEDATDVTFDPPALSPKKTLAKAGDVLDVAAPEIVARITTTKKVLVAGLNEGDNTLTAIVPIARYRADYLFYVPEFQHNYLKVFAPKGVEVQLDGTTLPASAFKDFGEWRFAIVTVSSGAHRATATRAFGLMVFGNQDAGYVAGGLPSAYEYPGGLDLKETRVSVAK
jgi:hypothetical protein